MKLKQPNKPKVSVPAVWNNRVQDIASDAARKAIEIFIEDCYPTPKNATEMLQFRLTIHDAIEQNLIVKIVMYQLIVFLIDREKGNAKDRAEAKLLTWLRVFENNP